MKKIQYVIRNVFSAEIQSNTELTDTESVFNEIENYIARQNTTEKIIFFENLEIVCSKCGITLNLDEEKEYGMCVSCNSVEADKII